MKRRHRSPGRVLSIREHVGVTRGFHCYAVSMFLREKGKRRIVKEMDIEKSFSGCSSFEDVAQADERRKIRRLNDRLRIRDLHAANDD